VILEFFDSFFNQAAVGENGGKSNKRRVRSTRTRGQGEVIKAVGAKIGTFAAATQTPPRKEKIEKAHKVRI